MKRYCPTTSQVPRPAWNAWVNGGQPNPGKDLPGGPVDIVGAYLRGEVTMPLDLPPRHNGYACLGPDHPVNANAHPGQELCPGCDNWKYVGHPCLTCEARATMRAALAGGKTQGPPPATESPSSPCEDATGPVPKLLGGVGQGETVLIRPDGGRPVTPLDEAVLRGEGSIREKARILGVSPMTVQRRLAGQGRLDL